MWNQVLLFVYAIGVYVCAVQGQSLQQRPQGWSDWGLWSPCMTSCGFGSQFRTRVCYVRRRPLWALNCLGGRIQVKPCTKECAEKPRPTIDTTKAFIKLTTTATTRTPKTCPWSCDSSATSCGQPFLNRSKKISGGEDAKRNAWPWQVGIWSGEQLLCGATIICKSWIITSAHCFVDLNTFDFNFVNITLRIGSYFRNDHRDGTTTLHISKNNVIIHPRYNILRRTYDVALIKLHSPLTYSHKVSPACLPDYFSLSVQPGANCFVLGWGEAAGKGSTSSALKQLPFKVRSNNLCRITYSFSSTFMILCAGGLSNQTTCKGDSGGPLMCRSPKTGNWEIQGVVSFGSRICGRRNSPTIFMQVSFFLPWIRSVMKSACVAAT